MGAEIVTRLMDDSRVTFCIKPGPDAMLQAETVGGVLTNLQNLFSAMGREDGVSVKTLVENIVSEKDGTISVHLLISRGDKKTNKNTGRAA